MNESSIIIVLSLVIALSAALLTWFIIDIGANAMAAYRANFTEKAKFQVREFFLFVDPRKLFVANLAMMALGVGLTWIVTGNLLIAAASLFALSMLPRLLYALMVKRKQRDFEAQLPDALLMVSGGLRAGVSLSSSIQQLVAEAQPPLKQEFGLMLKEQRLGVSLEQSLGNLSRRMPTQTTTLVVSAMRIASETGGGLAETLERTSQTIRSRLQMEGKISALTSQGKLQGWVAGLLPLALMAILDRMEPEAMSLMWHSRLGWIALGAIAFLEFMGIYVIRKIVAIDV